MVRLDPREFSRIININTFYNTHTPNNIGAFVAHEDFVSSFPFVGTSVTPCDTAEIADLRTHTSDVNPNPHPPFPWSTTTTGYTAVSGGRLI